jgi:hypothetical protein
MENRIVSFKESMRDANSRPAFFDVRTPLKLPDALRGEKYAFVGLPVAEFQPGGGVNESNIGVGKLCEFAGGHPLGFIHPGHCHSNPSRTSAGDMVGGNRGCGNVV